MSYPIYWEITKDVKQKHIGYIGTEHWAKMGY